jgi:hypothetical protein
VFSSLSYSHGNELRQVQLNTSHFHVIVAKIFEHYVCIICDIKILWLCFLLNCNTETYIEQGGMQHVFGDVHFSVVFLLQYLCHLYVRHVVSIVPCSYLYLSSQIINIEIRVTFIYFYKDSFCINFKNEVT